MDDSRHLFLNAGDRPVRLGQDQVLPEPQDRTLIPTPVRTHPDRWRLDQLLVWEEKRTDLAEAALEALLAPGREEVGLTDLLPQPKRRRRAG